MAKLLECFNPTSATAKEAVDTLEQAIVKLRTCGRVEIPCHGSMYPNFRKYFGHAISVQLQSGERGLLIWIPNVEDVNTLVAYPGFP